METIKIYLENMFLNLPDTPQVQRAKQELLQMMEDKYAELKEQGSTENEAVGIVISEFGNLEELAEGLGIAGMVQQEPVQEIQGKMLSLEEVKRYLTEKRRNAWLVAIGVLLCIVSVCGPILGSAVGELVGREDFFDAFGVVFMFILIAVAVGMFVSANMLMQEWEKLEQDVYYLNISTAEYVRDERSKRAVHHIAFMVTGVILCILSVTPVILLEELPFANEFIENISGGILFPIVGIGVLLIVYTSIQQGAYDTLLQLGRDGAGKQKKSKGYSNPQVDKIMSLYWTTVTCFYLCWSFLSFDWHITWIIWPIAAVVNSMISVLAKKE